MVLEQTDFISGLLSVILVLISVYIGLQTASKYLKSRNKVFVFAGMACSGLFVGWYPSAATFVLYLFTGEVFSREIFFLIGAIPMGFLLSSWVYAVTELTYKRSQKYVLIANLIVCIAFYIAFFYYWITDISVIGELQSPVDVKYKGFTLYFYLYSFLVVAIGGLVLARELLKSESQESKLRGKFLIYTFIVWTFFGFLDAGLSLQIIVLIIVRIILMTTVITFYCGFFLPKPIKRMFIKEN